MDGESQGSGQQRSAGAVEVRVAARLENLAVLRTLIGAVGTGSREVDLVTLARGDSSAWREQLHAFAVISDAGSNHLRLVLGDDRIVGAVVMGDQALSRPLQQLVRERVDIGSVRHWLLQGPAEIHRALHALTERMASLGAA